MALDFSALNNALTSLNKALAKSAAAPDDEELRDACIQRFEYSFELCWKMLKRQLEQELPSPAEIDGYSYRQLFRVGAERGFVDDVEAWFDYRELRNITSHTYDEAMAGKVYNAIPAFATHATGLLSRLTSRAGA